MMVAVHRVAAVARVQLRVMALDRASLVGLAVVPLVVAAFAQPIFRPILHAAGYSRASGAEQSIPGLGAMFSLYISPLVSAAIFQEFSLLTWDRIRSSRLSVTELFLGKGIPWFGFGLVQQALLFALAPLLSLHSEGPVAGALILAISVAFFAICYGYFLAAIAQSYQQLQTLSLVGSILIAGTGGALAPVTNLPSIVHLVAPLNPIYWATQGYRGVLLDGASISYASAHAAAVIGCGVVLFTYARLRFNYDTQKRIP